MRRRTHLFVVAIDEDPIPGAFDRSRIEDDVRRILTDAVSHYNPQVVHVGDFQRDSNFLTDTSERVGIDTNVDLHYSAEQ